MSWFRSHRRRFALFSALVLALQVLAVSVASHANAASSADGSYLVPICTSDGVRFVDMSALGDEQAPSEKHQCPLCIVGCATCTAPALPYVYATVVLLLEPQTATPPQVAVVTAVPPAPLALRPIAPRGPPALV